MEKLLEKLNKLSLPATIIIASLVLGGFILATQVIKQQSIERQQEIKLQEDRRAEEAKAEQEQKEYVAKRKGDCYEIYEKERDKWNNVESNFYNEEKDVCEITYESTTGEFKYNEAVCEQKLKENTEQYEEELKKYESGELKIRPVKITARRDWITECRKYFTKEF